MHRFAAPLLIATLLAGTSCANQARGRLHPPDEERTFCSCTTGESSLAQLIVLDLTAKSCTVVAVFDEGASENHGADQLLAVR
jgi:hypothetical protein